VKVLVTGAAGFIGFHVASRLLADGHQVAGYDGMTDYYDPVLKQRRLEQLLAQPGFAFTEGMLEDRELLTATAAEFGPEVIIHLAAQAGVRYSLEAPDVYVSSNLVGTFNLLEVARETKPRHLLLASTSSVYGGNEAVPFAEAERTDFPMSLYAATKKAAEAMSHSHAHIWRTPTTCFRFFTVYGPWGRPDMALFKFVAAILDGEPIDVYGEGMMRRDCTHVDDLVEGVMRLIDAVPVAGEPVLDAGVADSLSPVAPWRVVNIAGGRPIPLLDFIAAVEDAVGTKAEKNLLPMQKGDVIQTCADPTLLKALTGFHPSTPVTIAAHDFVDWYRSEHGVG
jgi:UDP-glucuronate 4-epimerase